MVIYKILNNNLILSKDNQGHEVIIKGCGIAFQKKKGQQIDENGLKRFLSQRQRRSVKKFRDISPLFQKYILTLWRSNVNEVKEKNGMNLNDSIYFSLSDHIMGAISRLKTGNPYSEYASSGHQTSLS